MLMAAFIVMIMFFFADMSCLSASCRVGLRGPFGPFVAPLYHDSVGPFVTRFLRA